MNNFTILDLWKFQTPTGMRIICSTDVPCHLYCRMTTVTPVKHKEAIIKRGLITKEDIRFCFVSYEDNEQFYPSDTTLHYFNKPDWPVCETRYYYFIGTIGGVWSPSASAIFKHHRKELPPPTWSFGFKLPGTTSTPIEDIVRAGYHLSPDFGNAQSIVAELRAVNASQPTKCALYDSAGNFVAQTIERNDIPLAATWVTFTFPTPPAITKQYYSIAIWSSGPPGPPQVALYYQVIASANSRHRQIPYNGWPASIPFLIQANLQPSIYCVCTY